MDRSTELLERLRRRATDAPDRVAVREVAGGRTITYAALHADAMDLARHLRQLLRSPSAVILRCPNTLGFHVAFFGALAAEMTVFPVSNYLTDTELSAAIDNSAAGALIGPDMSIRQLGTGERFVGSALLLQSSGTTGLPKIVRRDARSLAAVSANMMNGIGLTSSDQVLSCVPLCHSYGLEHGLLAPIFAGATVHLAQRFELATVRRELSESRVTIFPAVPSIYEMLGNLPDGGDCFPALRLAYSAGGPLPASVFEKMQREYGVRVAQLYGATEIGSVTLSHPASDHFEPDSVGRAFEGVDLTIDPDGQLLVRATSMMSGYIGGDDSLMTEDGFFPTGDLARLDPRGNLFITGRLKFLIDVGGLKVNPMEVEQAIAQHPDVAACVVVPMRVTETIARLKAIVTPARLGRMPSPDELRRFARQRLSPHKVPRVFELRDALPRSATGKVLRHLLVESA